MQLIMIAGFLGSGKTTLLLELAKTFTSTFNRRVAIIENEVGKVGVDGQYLAQLGLQIREIQSGCVCCQLRGNLLATLYDLEAAYAPDFIFFEPSGVALPDQVVDVCRTYGGNIESIHVVMLVDAMRFGNPRIFALPLVTRGIMAANTIVVNKIDAVTEEELAAIRRKIEEFNPRAAFRPISALHGTNLGPFLKSMSDQYANLPESQPLPKMLKQSISKIDLPEDSSPQATAHAEQVALQFNPPVDSGHLLSQLSEYIQDFTNALRCEQCTLIGHVKAIVRPADENRAVGYALLSATDFNRAPTVRGALAPQVSQAQLTINAIVYGVDKATLARLIHSTLERLNGAVATPRLAGSV